MSTTTKLPADHHYRRRTRPKGAGDGLPQVQPQGSIQGANPPASALPIHLAPDQRNRLAVLLKSWFPWLGTDDPASGADTINELDGLYVALQLRFDPESPNPANQSPVTLAQAELVQLLLSVQRVVDLELTASRDHHVAFLPVEASDELIGGLAVVLSNVTKSLNLLGVRP